MILNYLKRAFQGWEIQKKVIKALIYRELKTRISRARFGFLGVLLEKLVTLGIFIAIFAFFRFRPTGGLNVFIFLGIGFMFYNSFQGTLISSLNAIDANRSLFSYQQVKPIDTVITRCLVEGLINFTILIILFAFTLFMEGSIFINNLPLLVLSFLSLIVVCLAIGIIAMVAGYRYEWVKIVIPFISRPLFFTSGILFSLRNIPQDLHRFLIWNPILHSIEVARNSVNNEYILADNLSVLFVIRVGLVGLTLALFIYQRNIKLFYGK